MGKVFVKYLKIVKEFYENKQMVYLCDYNNRLPINDLLDNVETILLQMYFQIKKTPYIKRIRLEKNNFKKYKK